MRGKESSWYASADEYWGKASKDYNGVMGGYGNLNEADVNDSKKYLNDIWGN